MLEKFEEVESKTLPHDEPTVKDISTVKDIPAHRTKSASKTQGKPMKQRKCQDNVPKKSVARTSNKHKITQDSSREKLAHMTKVIISVNNTIIP